MSQIIYTLQYPLTNTILSDLANKELPELFERVLTSKNDRLQEGIFSLPLQNLDKIKRTEGYKDIHKLCQKYGFYIGIESREVSFDYDIKEVIVSQV